MLKWSENGKEAGTGFLGFCFLFWPRMGGTVHFYPAVHWLGSWGSLTEVGRSLPVPSWPTFPEFLAAKNEINSSQRYLESRDAKGQKFCTLLKRVIHLAYLLDHEYLGKDYRRFWLMDQWASKNRWARRHHSEQGEKLDGVLSS